MVNIPHVRVCQVVPVHHAWRTFTLSWLSQPGVWLLRRLLPPTRTLAVSGPTTIGIAVWEFPRSSTRDERNP